MLWDELQMESIGDCFRDEQSSIRYVLKFELKEEPRNCSMSRQMVWTISDQMWRCHGGLKRNGLASTVTPKFDPGFDRLDKLLLLQDYFQELKRFRASLIGNEMLS